MVMSVMVLETSPPPLSLLPGIREWSHCVFIAFAVTRHEARAMAHLIHLRARRRLRHGLGPPRPGTEPESTADRFALPPCLSLLLV